MPKQLTKAQLEPVYLALRSKRDFLCKLKQRLKANGFTFCFVRGSGGIALVRARPPVSTRTSNCKSAGS